MYYDESVTYSELYDIISDKYSEVPITAFPFSNRVSNSLRRNGIETGEALLKTTPAQLKNIKGFGRSCLDEISSFWATVQADETASRSLMRNRNSIIRFEDHSSQITLDNIPFAEQSARDKSRLQVASMEEAYRLFGEELIKICIDTPERIFPIIDMLNRNLQETKAVQEIQKLLQDIPAHRRDKKAIWYIKAFTIDEAERQNLKAFCESDSATLAEFVSNIQLQNSHVFLLAKKFLKWCAFDLTEEIRLLLERLYINDRAQAVVRLRAAGQTLEQVGNALGVTRERVRQIELRVRRNFAKLHGKVRIISKIAAEHNGDTIISPDEISCFCDKQVTELLYLLQSYEGANYIYDKHMDVFVVGNDSLTERVQRSIEMMPELVKASQLSSTLNEMANESELPLEMLTKAFEDTYRLTGEVYHRYRLSPATIYERVLDSHYPQGFKAYDPSELSRFREIVMNEYGDVGLPVNDHALTSRIASICILCGRGVYRTKKKEYLPRHLANKICNYIETNENTIFLTNTLFSVFKSELLAVGIDNKYFLQGVLHELFADKFVFRRDYISKDTSVTSLYSAVVGFIQKSNFPVSKTQIYNAFPGITEIVISLSVNDHNVLNYFGEYLHSSKLTIYKRLLVLWKVFKKVCS